MNFTHDDILDAHIAITESMIKATDPGHESFAPDEQLENGRRLIQLYDVVYGKKVPCGTTTADTNEDIKQTTTLINVHAGYVAQQQQQQAVTLVHRNRLAYVNGYRIPNAQIHPFIHQGHHVEMKPAKMKAYQCSGLNGAVFIFDNGSFIDTTTGDTLVRTPVPETTDSFELNEWGNKHCIWVDSPQDLDFFPPDSQYDNEYFKEKTKAL